MEFQDPQLLSVLASATPDGIDQALFGVVAMDKSGTVEIYNRAESVLAGLTSDKAIGRHFFSAVAPCTNNYMVAQRFEEAEELDTTIDYVFTLKMRPTKVRLRLLKSAAVPNQYLIVELR